MSTIIKARLILLLAASMVLVAGLTACGGGGSSVGAGGGAGGTIVGTLDGGLAAAQPADAEPLLAALASVVVKEARAAGIAGVTVELFLNGSSTPVATTTTDSGGNFMFTGLAPGSYTISLSQGGSALGETPPIQVDGTTPTNIKVTLSGNNASVEVEGEGTQISGEVQNQTTDNSSTSQDSSSTDSSSEDTGTEDNGTDSNASDDSSEGQNSGTDQQSNDQQSGDGSGSDN